LSPNCHQETSRTGEIGFVRLYTYLSVCVNVCVSLLPSLFPATTKQQRLSFLCVFSLLFLSFSFFIKTKKVLRSSLRLPLRTPFLPSSLSSSLPPFLPPSPRTHTHRFSRNSVLYVCVSLPLRIAEGERMGK